MTREELKLHCERQVESCERWAKFHGEEPHGKIYEEHKLILELLEQELSEDAAKECYEDLCRYFGDAKDILKNREDFKAWLDRIKWHIHKAEELLAKNDDLRDQLAMRDRFQKQEPCEDCISRQASIEGLTELINNLKGVQGDMGSAVNAARELIKSLPPVTPQPKTGHWNSYFTEIKGNDTFNCMECGSTFIVEQGAHNMNYCPNCGVKMIESQEGENNR